MRDWFVVGPSVVLRGTGDGLPVVFAVDGPVVGELTLERAADGAVTVRTDVPGAEAVRLAARLVWLLDPEAIGIRLDVADDDVALAADGFVGGFRPATPFTTGSAAGMEELYSDPMAVPWNFEPREHDVLNRARAVLADRPAETRVLDLGCGYGKNATFLEECGYHVSGIDVSSTAIARCRELVRRPDAFVAGSATALPWPDATFDLVLDVGCLHCVPAHDRTAAVAELRRVLAPRAAVVSRLFLPRSEAWVGRLPFAATSFGVAPDAARALFSSAFANVAVETHDGCVYVTAVAA